MQQTAIDAIARSVRWVAVCFGLALMLVTSAGTVTAQDGSPVVVDPTSCGHFETQQDAQDALDTGSVANPENLDADGDGIACENRWGEIEGGPVVVDPTSCGHFETQEDAQEAFDTDSVANPENLDADGDGIVCEFRWGEVETGDTDTPDVVSLPDTGTGPATTTTYGTVATVLTLICAAAAWGLRARITS